MQRMVQKCEVSHLSMLFYNLFISQSQEGGGALNIKKKKKSRLSFNGDE